MIIKYLLVHYYLNIYYKGIYCMNLWTPFCRKNILLHYYHKVYFKALRKYKAIEWRNPKMAFTRSKELWIRDYCILQTKVCHHSLNWLLYPPITICFIWVCLCLFMSRISQNLKCKLFGIDVPWVKDDVAHTPRFHGVRTVPWVKEKVIDCLWWPR